MVKEIQITKYVCKFCGRKFDGRTGAVHHERHCYINPSSVIKCENCIRENCNRTLDINCQYEYFHQKFKIKLKDDLKSLECRHDRLLDKAGEEIYVVKSLLPLDNDKYSLFIYDGYRIRIKDVWIEE